MDSELEKKLQQLESKIDAAYRSAERTRRMFMWTLIISVATIVLPLLGLIILIPLYVQTLEIGGLL
ncbi:MAG: hypothetical protein ACOYUK_00105 [Patescibacteria group bacterium]|jgi:type IV secretory pathway component VirB8